MRRPLSRRLVDLFALLLAVRVTVWAIIATFQAENGLKALLLGALASLFAGIVYRAGRAMLHDWQAPGP